MKASELPIVSPCGADWRAMSPASGGRFCGDCKKVVHDLSRLSERGARALLAREENRELCVRYLADHEGRIVFADAPALIPGALLARARRAAAAAVAVAAPLAAFGAAGCSGSVPGAHARAQDGLQVEDDGAVGQVDGGTWHMGAPPERPYDAGPAEGGGEADAGPAEGGGEADAGPAEDGGEADAGPAEDGGPRA